MLRVGVCGYGYWGPRLVRAFSGHPAFQVVAVADRRPECQAAIKAINNRIAVYDEADDLIVSGTADVVSIATPVSTHFELAAKALRTGLHVLIEKPMATSAAEAEELVAIAAAQDRVLLVDHVYVFHDAVLKLKELKQSGALGAVSYYDSLRVNLGLFQPDVNVLWDLAPHDFSVLDFLFEEEPTHVDATGYAHVNPTLPDIAYVTLHYPSRMIAHMNLSWMSPVKARRIAIGGSRQMAVWDDLNVTERLQIYTSGISFQAQEQRNTIIPSYRIGEVYSPPLPQREPLARLVEHFANTIRTRGPSPADGKAGLRIVSLLERTQKRLDAALRSTQAPASGSTVIRFG